MKVFPLIIFALFSVDGIGQKVSRENIKFSHVDTTIGYVGFIDSAGQHFQKGMRIDSIFTLSHYVPYDCNTVTRLPNGGISTTLLSCPDRLVETEHRKTVTIEVYSDKRCFCPKRRLDLDKNWTFTENTAMQ